MPQSSTPFNRSNPVPETTGRYLVLLNTDEISEGIQTMNAAAGVGEVAHAADFSDNAPDASLLAGDTPLLFDELGVAVVTMDPTQVQSLNVASAGTSSVVAVEPERVVYALSNVNWMSNVGASSQFMPSQAQAIPAESTLLSVSADYLQGYRDAINTLVDRLLDADGDADIEGDGGGGNEPPNGSITWGLQKTKVDISSYSGLGIKVAVLDTGFDLTHPDFFGRLITSQSFIEGEEVQDGNGHGTHCIGTACGSQSPSSLPRYGVAYNAEIYAGKVLSNEGSGSDGGILAGINWAIANGCQVISMSLGAYAAPGQAFSTIYEQVGRRSLRRGSLIVAAAGNDSRRQFGQVEPVSHPANCPSIMAVAALSPNLKVAYFSNGGINRKGGQIDIAAPGVDVYSSWPMPTRYNTISGTSMATPHVAGLAALQAEATGATGRELWAQLTQNAWRLSLSTRDVGSGLAQAVD